MKDYGFDPLGDGTFKMIPSGDIVDRAERLRRIPLKTGHHGKDIFNMSWDELETRQGGKLTRPKNKD